MDVSTTKLKLPATNSTPQILENYTNINALIEKMHTNILQVFQKRENELLTNYKKEMIKAYDMLSYYR